MRGGGGGHKCQLSVKISAFYQIAVRFFRPFVSCQVNDC